MARWNSCLKQIVTTRLFGLGIAIIVLPLSAIKNQKPCKLSLKTEAKSVLKANKYSQITMQNGDPLMGAYIQNNVITEWLISRHASCGFISSSNSSINFPASATHFFVAVTDFWSIGIIAFPYGKNETTLYLGQYDEGGKTWRWIAK